MEMVDYDSDEERSNFFCNKSSASTRWSSPFAELTYTNQDVNADKIWFSKVHREYSVKKTRTNKKFIPVGSLLKLKSFAF